MIRRPFGEVQCAVIQLWLGLLGLDYFDGLWGFGFFVLDFFVLCSHADGNQYKQQSEYLFHDQYYGFNAIFNRVDDRLRLKSAKVNKFRVFFIVPPPNLP